MTVADSFGQQALNSLCLFSLEYSSFFFTCFLLLFLWQISFLLTSLHNSCLWRSEWCCICLVLGIFFLKNEIFFWQKGVQVKIWLEVGNFVFKVPRSFITLYTHLISEVCLPLLDKTFSYYLLVSIWIPKTFGGSRNMELYIKGLDFKINFCHAQIY